MRNDLNDVAFLILYGSHKCVEVWIFSAPLLHVLQYELCSTISALLEVSLTLYNLYAIVVEELVFYYRLSLYLCIDLNYTISIVVLKVWSNLDV